MARVCIFLDITLGDRECTAKVYLKFVEGSIENRQIFICIGMRGTMDEDKIACLK